MHRVPEIWRGVPGNAFREILKSARPICVPLAAAAPMLSVHEEPLPEGEADALEQVRPVTGEKKSATVEPDAS